jgi:hypothetical protein
MCAFARESLRVYFYMPKKEIPMPLQIEQWQLHDLIELNMS